MALQLRAGAALLACGGALHGAYVLRERGAAPTGRALRLSPGSADAEAVAALKTGDLLLFARDATLYLPPGALVLLLRRLRGGSGGALAFDHAGVVVVDALGEPRVLEASLSGGATLRPIEHRLRRTRSGTLVARPLAAPLAPAQAAAARAFAAAEAARAPPREGALGALASAGAVAGELVALALAADANASVALVEQFYGAVGGFERGGGGGGGGGGSGGTSATARPLAMRDLAPAPPADPQPFEGEACRFGRTRWLRDRIV
jgi:hypothetical protein